MTINENYALYLFEDFLLDDFFMESVKRPTDETVAFWNQFLESNPMQVNTFKAAQMFIEDL